VSESVVQYIKKRISAFRRLRRISAFSIFTKVSSNNIQIQ
jgi:hypothetical protein